MKIKQAYNGDLIVSVVMIIFTLVLFWQITTISVADSRILPTFALIVSGISALSLLFKSLKRKGDHLNSGFLFFTKKEVVVLALLIICYFLMQLLGFYTAIFIFLSLLSLLITPNLKMNSILSVILTNAVLSAVLFVAFGVVLKMVTPAGLLI